MLTEIWLLVSYNLYESKRYFATHFVEAFLRKGISARLFEFNENLWLKELQAHPSKRPDLICSFHRSTPLPSGKMWWDDMKLPFLSMLVDPAVQYPELLNSPYGAVSCVDHFDCDFFKERGFNNVFFLPHAIERELAPNPALKKIYDVVFIGSSYDPESLRQYWLKTSSKPISDLLDAASEITLSRLEVPYWSAVQQAAKALQVELTEKNYRGLCTFVDIYTRGIDRLNLIKSIKSGSIHLFGGTISRPAGPVRGWAQLLSKQSNITFHPAIPFQESLEVLKQSKICLNSMPFFKNGSHERIFTGLGCGALPITTQNLWVKDQFVEGEELVTYRSGKWDEVNSKVDHYLTHEVERSAIVDRGRAKVMQHHTWDHRVSELIQGLNSLQSWPASGSPLSSIK